jgi:hypothetical protein
MPGSSLQRGGFDSPGAKPQPLQERVATKTLACYPPVNRQNSSDSHLHSATCQGIGQEHSIFKKQLLQRALALCKTRRRQHVEIYKAERYFALAKNSSEYSLIASNKSFSA